MSMYGSTMCALKSGPFAVKHITNTNNHYVWWPYLLQTLQSNWILQICKMREVKAIMIHFRAHTLWTRIQLCANINPHGRQNCQIRRYAKISHNPHWLCQKSKLLEWLKAQSLVSEAQTGDIYHGLCLENLRRHGVQPELRKFSILPYQAWKTM